MGSIEKDLDQFFLIHAQTWKGKEENSEFYYKIAREFSQRKEFVMYCLCLNERPIAYMFGLKFKNGLFGIKTTYDPSFHAFSPGTYMFYKIIEDCCNARDIDKFDIGRGDERYKQDLASRPIDQLIFIAGHKKSFSSYVYHVRFKVVLYIKKKKLLMTGLTFFKNSNVMIKKIQDYFKQKILTQRPN